MSRSVELKQLVSIMRRLGEEGAGGGFRRRPAGVEILGEDDRCGRATR